MRRPAGVPARASAKRDAPLLWTFDGPLAACLGDVEQTLRRTIVQLGDVSGIAVALDVSLPALAQRVRAGDAIQPAWRSFLQRTSRYGFPSALRVRHRSDAGPLFTLVVLYRS
jgi:hypothetical protein